MYQIKLKKCLILLGFPAPEKRPVNNQGNLLIIENKDEKLEKHLVANLPIPFVPAIANRVLTKLAVIT